jgi:hypothetical protein
MWLRNALTLVVSAVMCLAVMGRPQLGAPAADDRPATMIASAIDAPMIAPVIATAIDAPTIAPVLTHSPAPAHRPPALVPLYVSFAALQALDIHSTLRAPQFGGREANPIVGGMLGSPVAFVAAKAGMTAGIYFASERLWKRHKAAAILTMIALDSTYGAIVAHNYAVEARAVQTP